MGYRIGQSEPTSIAGGGEVHAGLRDETGSDRDESSQRQLTTAFRRSSRLGPVVVQGSTAGRSSGCSASAVPDRKIGL
jgi:hypothetical protein